MTSYKSISEITLDKYIHMANHPIGKKAKNKLLTWRGLNSLGLAVMTVNSFLCLKSGDDMLFIISGIFAVIFGYKLLIQRPKTLKKQYADIIANIPGGKWIRTVTFDENIIVSDGNSATTFKYSDYAYATENDRYFLLYRNENVVLRIEKDSFVIGDREKFLKWINNKLSKKK